MVSKVILQGVGEGGWLLPHRAAQRLGVRADSSVSKPLGRPATVDMSTGGVLVGLARLDQRKRPVNDDAHRTGREQAPSFAEPAQPRWGSWRGGWAGPVAGRRG